jgi:RNA polymerase sigma factor (sigma-70 family)
MSDHELIRKCIEKNEQAQSELYRKYSGKLMTVCLRYAPSQELAHDMFQDGFIKIFNKLDQFDGSGSIGSWLRRVMVNTCLDHLRRIKRKGVQLEIQDDLLIHQSDFGVEQMLGEKDLLKLVQKLPEGYRVVFNMFAIEGYSHKEIAKELNIAENTSKSQYRKARLWLISALEKMDKGVYLK